MITNSILPVIWHKFWNKLHLKAHSHLITILITILVCIAMHSNIQFIISDNESDITESASNDIFPLYFITVDFPILKKNWTDIKLYSSLPREFRTTSSRGRYEEHLQHDRCPKHTSKYNDDTQSLNLLFWWRAYAVASSRGQLVCTVSFFLWKSSTLIISLFRERGTAISSPWFKTLRCWGMEEN